MSEDPLGDYVRAKMRAMDRQETALREMAAISGALPGETGIVCRYVRPPSSVPGKVRNPVLVVDYA